MNRKRPDNGEADLIGKRIREARKRCGLTQIDVGLELGVVRSMVSKWESGDASIPIGRINSLCGILHVSPNWLFSYDDDKNEDWSKT